MTFKSRGTVLLFCLLISVAVQASYATSDEDEAAQRAAEDAAAAVVGDAADAEQDDDADAMDEDADASRFDPDDPDHHPLTNMPPSSKDIEIGRAFSADSTAGILTLGKEHRIIVGFANNGRVAYYIWGIMGSLNMPNDFGVHVQNFSYALINQTVPAGSELSFEYTFVPNERLDTRVFTMALSVFYEARNVKGNVIRAHATTFFNETVATEAGPQAVNNTAFVLIFMLLLIAGGGGIYYVKATADSAKLANVEMGTGSSATEWLEEHHSMLRGGGRTKSKAN